MTKSNYATFLKVLAYVLLAAGVFFLVLSFANDWGEGELIAGLCALPSAVFFYALSIIVRAAQTYINKNKE